MRMKVEGRDVAQEAKAVETLDRAVNAFPDVGTFYALRASYYEHRDATRASADLDKAIEKNLHAQLVRNKLDHDVRYDVKNGVVTLKGTVNSQTRRAMVEKLATGVPNVQQVVNELEVKGQKATTSS